MLLSLVISTSSSLDGYGLPRFALWAPEYIQPSAMWNIHDREYYISARGQPIGRGSYVSCRRTWNLTHISFLVSWDPLGRAVNWLFALNIVNITARGRGLSLHTLYSQHVVTEFLVIVRSFHVASLCYPKSYLYKSGCVLVIYRVLGPCRPTPPHMQTMYPDGRLFQKVVPTD